MCEGVNFQENYSAYSRSKVVRSSGRYHHGCRYGENMFVRDYPMMIPYRSASCDSSAYPVSVSSK